MITRHHPHKKIILTGGGTAGHVTPNLAILPLLRAEGFEVVYAGGRDGIERGMAESAGLPYRVMSSGKLRRYLSVKNLTDIFRVAKGLSDARKIIKEEKPDIIFSKGGFVGVPLVVAARMAGVPVVIHESDLTPGLANRISYPFADRVCVSFPDTVRSVPKGKGRYTGAIVRSELLAGDAGKGLALCGFNGNKPVLLVTGGGSGSRRINETVVSALDGLLESFDVIHLCGKGNLNAGINRGGYHQTEFAGAEMRDLLACAAVVVSRAGANSISEFLLLKKPNLLIPLPKAATSRGDQLENAASFSGRGFSAVLLEGELSPERLIGEVSRLYRDRNKYVSAMSGAEGVNGAEGAVGAILELLSEKKR